MYMFPILSLCPSQIVTSHVKVICGECMLGGFPEHDQSVKFEARSSRQLGTAGAEKVAISKRESRLYTSSLEQIVPFLFPSCSPCLCTIPLLHAFVPLLLLPKPYCIALCTVPCGQDLCCTSLCCLGYTYRVIVLILD